MIKAASIYAFSSACNTHFLGFFKFTLFVIVLILFILHHSLTSLIIFNEELRLRYFMTSISLTSKMALRILNVKVSLTGVRGEVQKRLIVANHLSYLDVLVLFSHFPSLFVTSVEIRETFLLGRICRLAGCFFVERRKNKRNQDTKSEELNLMLNKFNKGFNIFLFPEGTSSDGTTVLPFKSTFFQLALDTQTPVVPISLKYVGESKNAPPWFGDMTFIDHLYRLCCAPVIEATVTVLPEIQAADRTELAEKSWQSIKNSYDH